MTHAVNKGLEGSRPLRMGWSSADDLSVALTVLTATPRELGTGRLVALVPAHNEQDTIELALDSLRGQTRRPDLIVVAADNCTDDTVPTARQRGDAVVYETQRNSDKKAGALNQLLAYVLPALDDDDAVLVMDADSALDAGFLEAAMRHLGTTRRTGKQDLVVGGVGGTFRGGRGGGFVGMLQRNEYARYARDVRRRKGSVLVLTGTAAIFSVKVLRQVIAARAEGRLPGEAKVYDTRVLTEDNELTLALLHLGYTICSPKECLLETEVMTTWRDLWNQRLRWKRGAIENLVDYGWTRVTRRYWGRQLLTHIGVLVTTLYLSSVVWTLATTGSLRVQPIWLAVTGVFALERIVTVRERGAKQMALGGLVVVEMAFDLFLQAVQARAFWDSITRTERNW